MSQELDNILLANELLNNTNVDHEHHNQLHS